MPSTAEQDARDMLERMGVPDAQGYTAGRLVELANLIAGTPKNASNAFREGGPARRSLDSPDGDAAIETLLAAIDQEVVGPEYGLPMHDDGAMAQLTAMVRRWVGDL